MYWMSDATIKDLVMTAIAAEFDQTPEGHGLDKAQRILERMQGTQDRTEYEKIQVRAWLELAGLAARKLEKTAKETVERRFGEAILEPKDLVQKPPATTIPGLYELGRGNILKEGDKYELPGSSGMGYIPMRFEGQLVEAARAELKDAKFWRRKE